MQFGDFYFDGDKKKVYEAPTGFSYTLDGDGYRIYTPDNPQLAPTALYYSTYDLWSRSTDFIASNDWSTLVLDISGGAYRYTDQYANDVYALIDIRFINGWQYVPANYPHETYIKGNLYADIGKGKVFDTERLTEFGVVPSIQFSDAGERAIIGADTSSDTVAPTWDSIIGISNAYQNGSTINISWGKASDKNEVSYNIYVSKYSHNVFDSASLYTKADGYFYSLSGFDGESFVDGTTYYIGVRAVDSAENETSNSNYATVVYDAPQISATIDENSLHTSLDSYSNKDSWKASSVDFTPVLSAISNLNDITALEVRNAFDPNDFKSKNNELEIHSWLDSYSNKGAWKANLSSLSSQITLLGGKVDEIPTKVWGYDVL